MGKFFAIRKKSTGEFLPAFGRRRGHTRAEPTDEKPPRLYLKKGHAKHALDWWLKGITTTVCYDYEMGDEEWRTTPVPGRDTSDMEIVELKLEVI